MSPFNAKSGHYIRQAKAARDLASATNSDLIRTQFEKIAQNLELLAKERLSLLQLKIDKVGADALPVVAIGIAWFSHSPPAPIAESLDALDGVSQSCC